MSDAFWVAAFGCAATIFGIWWTGRKVGDVHKIVNSQRTEMQREIDELRKLIKQSQEGATTITAAQSAGVAKAATKM